MQMKQMIAIAGLTLAMPLAAFADKSDDVIKALNLQGAKASQVKTILDNYQDQKKSIKERTKNELEALKDRKEKQLDDVLTDEQMDQLEKWHDARKDRYKDQHKECKKLLEKYDD